MYITANIGAGLPEGADTVEKGFSGGRTTSQNAPQPLVSNKCDLADSNGSDLTSVE
jgi:hypothetical protein